MSTDHQHRRIQEYERAKNLDWEPRTVARSDTLLDRTKYDLPKKGYDPFRLTAVEYAPMELEKDHGLFGMIDGAIRHNAGGKIEPRFGEYVKLIGAVLPYAEHTATRIFGRAIRSIDVPALQSGYSFQMLDEMRHFQIEVQAFNKFHLKHGYPDPYGFDRWPDMYARNIAGNIFRAGVEHFGTNDPVSSLVSLQMFFETASTNALFVALPDIAVANGDDVYATCGLSIQSDEARHMANGYATLMSMIEASDRNIEHLNHDMTVAAWREMTFLSLPIAFVYEAAAKKRLGRSAYELWTQYVHEQFYGSYMAKLEKFGIRIPEKLVEDMKEWMYWGPHTLHIFSQLAWPLIFWRQEPIEAPDFEYFEAKYPGYTERYGPLWEIITGLSERGQGGLATLEGLKLLGKGLQLCQVCNLPTIFPHPMEADKWRRFVKKGDRTLAFCSEWCEWIYDLNPAQYQSEGYLKQYQGWNLGDIIRHQNLLRPDGKTILGQPRLDTLGTDRMWTVDDIDALGIELDLCLD